jgi:cytochrome c-type biogenesis protein CcmH
VSSDFHALPVSRGKKPLLVLLALVVLALLIWLVLRQTARPGVAQGAGPATAASEPGKGLKPLSDDQLERMVGQNDEKTAKDPKDKVAWAMLAHSHEMLGQFSEATKAYAKLAELAPQDAQVLADYADALGVAHGRSLVGEPAALIKRALAADGKNVKALMLAGALAIEQGDKARAVEVWQKARDNSTNAALQRQIDQNLAQAKAELAAPPTASAAGATAVLALGAAPAPLPAASRPRLVQGPARLSGRVWLAADLLAQASPDATVFIFARPADGSRMPVALLRKKVKDLPFEFTLDESMAMTKAISLANVDAAVIVARVSARGDVMPQAGDLQGVSAPVPVGASGIKLEIGEVLK